MVLFNEPLFKKLLNNLSTIIDAKISFYDEDYQDTIAEPECSSPFCSLIKPNLYNMCVNTDTIQCKRAATCKEQCFSYTCHFGLTEILIRFQINSTPIYIIIGPFRKSANEEMNIKQIEEYCTKYGVDEKQMLDAYYKISEYSEEKFNSITEMISVLCEYARTKNLITVRDDIFETDIAPYIKQNLQGDLSISALCNKFFVTPKQLYNIIYKATKLSPKRYITTQRILKAKN